MHEMAAYKSVTDLDAMITRRPEGGGANNSGYWLRRIEDVVGSRYFHFEILYS